MMLFEAMERATVSNRWAMTSKYDDVVEIEGYGHTPVHWQASTNNEMGEGTGPANVITVMAVQNRRLLPGPFFSAHPHTEFFYISSSRQSILTIPAWKFGGTEIFFQIFSTSLGASRKY